MPLFTPTPRKSISFSTINSNNEKLCAGVNELNLRRKLLVTSIVPWHRILSLLSKSQPPFPFYCVAQPTNEYAIAWHRLELELADCWMQKVLFFLAMLSGTESHRAWDIQNKTGLIASGWVFFRANKWVLYEKKYNSGCNWMTKPHQPCSWL